MYLFLICIHTHTYTSSRILWKRCRLFLYIHPLFLEKKIERRKSRNVLSHRGLLKKLCLWIWGKRDSSSSSSLSVFIKKFLLNRICFQFLSMQLLREPSLARQFPLLNGCQKTKTFFMPLRNTCPQLFPIQVYIISDLLILTTNRNHNNFFMKFFSQINHLLDLLSPLSSLEIKQNFSSLKKRRSIFSNQNKIQKKHGILPQKMKIGQSRIKFN